MGFDFDFHCCCLFVFKAEVVWISRGCLAGNCTYRQVLSAHTNYVDLLRRFEIHSTSLARANQFFFLAIRSLYHKSEGKLSRIQSILANFFLFFPSVSNTERRRWLFLLIRLIRLHLFMVRTAGIYVFSFTFRRPLRTSIWQKKDNTVLLSVNGCCNGCESYADDDTIKR